jgi:hypothetical protein
VTSTISVLNEIARDLRPATVVNDPDPSASTFSRRSLPLCAAMAFFLNQMVSDAIARCFESARRRSR